jgi:hypothetical protein
MNQTEFKWFSCLLHRDPETILKFSTDCVNNVVEAYCPLVLKHKDDKFTPENKQWQQVTVCCMLMCIKMVLCLYCGLAERFELDQY